MSQCPKKKEERGERKAGFKVSLISSSTDVTCWQSHSHEDNKETATIAIAATQTIDAVK